MRHRRKKRQNLHRRHDAAASHPSTAATDSVARPDTAVPSQDRRQRQCGQPPSGSSRRVFRLCAQLRLGCDVRAPHAVPYHDQHVFADRTRLAVH